MRGLELRNDEREYEEALCPDARKRAGACDGNRSRSHIRITVLFIPNEVKYLTSFATANTSLVPMLAV